MTEQTVHTTSPLIGKKIEDTPIQSIKPNPLNPIKYPPAKLAKFANYISRYGTDFIVVLDTENQIVTGYAQWRAAELAGRKTVPTVKIDHLSREEVLTFMLADQKLAEAVEWDDKQLKSIFHILTDYQLVCETDYDLSLTGFETSEIDNFVFIDGPEDDLSQVEQLLEKIENQKPVSKEGDIWLMGHHRLLCGDSLVLDNYKLLLKDKQINLVATDPPYNLKISGFVSGNGAVKHREFKNGSGEYHSSGFTKFLSTAMSHSCTALANGGLVYVFMDWRHVTELLAAADELKLQQLNLCVWDKGCGGMGSFYRSQHELAFVFRHGDKQHRNNIMLGKHGRNRTNVWRYPSANMSQEGREMLKNHPTPKPVPMIMDIIKDVTKPGDIVLDPFMGSGTTLIAAEKTGRYAYGIDADPLYVDLAVRRWELLTGKKAMHAVTGMSFADTQAATTIKVRERSREKIRK